MHQKSAKMVKRVGYRYGGGGGGGGGIERVERGSRWILYSSFQLLLRATVADAFIFFFIFFIFPFLMIFMFKFILFLISGIWGSYVIYYLRVSVAKIF